MDSINQDSKYIELRSEKVRNIIGAIPSVFVRQGTVITSVVLLLLILVAAFTPYTKSLSVSFSLYSIPAVQPICASSNGLCFFRSLPKFVIKDQIIGHVINNDSCIPIISPISGKLIQNIASNDLVFKDQILFIVISQEAENTFVRCQVNAALLSNIHVNQNVTIVDNTGFHINGTIASVDSMTVDSGAFVVISFSSSEIQNITTLSNHLNAEIIIVETSWLRHFIQLIKF